MPTTKEAIENTLSLIGDLSQKVDQGVGHQTFSQDLATVSNLISAQSEHLLEHSRNLVKMAYRLSLDLKVELEKS